MVMNTNVRLHCISVHCKKQTNKKTTQKNKQYST